MTDEQFDLIMKASKPVTYMVIGGTVPASPQENANRAWKAVAEEHGVDWLSIKPAPGKDNKYFTAIPKIKEDV